MCGEISISNRPSPISELSVAPQTSISQSSLNTLEPVSQSISNTSEAAEPRDPNIARWNAERRLREASEEKERWWSYARLQLGEAPSDDATNVSTSVAVRKNRAPLAPADYKKWDLWVQAPEDPVSKAEAKALQEQRDRVQDAAFEQANPAFVTQFQEDAARRKAAELAKESEAAKAKERGNASFKRGDHRAALVAYHDSLRLTPFSVATLNNIAFVHLTIAKAAVVSAATAITAAASSPDSPSTAFPLQTAAEDTIEFTTRALFVDPRNVKALFRRASAQLLLGSLIAAGEVLCPHSRCQTISRSLLFSVGVSCRERPSCCR
jgi:hypothetical protein